MCISKKGTFSPRHPVKTAGKNLYFVEIIEGLTSGDTIALSVPEDTLRSSDE